jgi:hypothetical protein
MKMSTMLPRIALAAALVFAGAVAHAQSIEVGGKSYASIQAYLAGAWQTEQGGSRIRMDFTEGGILVLEHVRDGAVRHGVYQTTPQELIVMVKRICIHGKCHDTPYANPVVFPLKLVAPNKLMSGTEEWERLSNR